MIHELASEQCGHDPHWNEKPLPACNPAASVGRQSAAGYNTVDMRMIHKVLSPGVENADKPYACAEMLRIIRECHKCLRDRTEQDVIHDPLVHDNQGIQLRRYGKDYMEVLNGQKIFASGLNPLLLLQGLALGTMPVPAGVVGYIRMAAAVLIPMSAKSSSPAYFNGVHGTQMIKRHPVGPSIVLPVLTEDIGHLDALRRPHRRYR